jgi:TolB-like protein/DNA-binding winged helix-turn-helix (wHTH) protein/Flp pilus assembly protein TadD
MSVEERFFEFGPFRVDVTERVLLRQGKPVQLTLKAFDTLLVLVERRGHIVEREELMKTVWPDSFVEEGNLTVTISMLRKVLEGGEDGHSYIETVPRRGYRFTVEVREQRSNESGPLEQADRRLSAEGKDPVVFDDQGVGVAETQSNRLKVPTHSRKRWAVVVLAVVVTGLLAALLLRREGKVDLEIKSLAVLPLRNLSGDPEQEYFSDAMTEALIENLSKIAALRVPSRTSAMHYKGAAKPLSEIARELRVQAIVEGSVLRSGNRVRISAQLIHVRDDRQLWAGSYEGDLDDILSLQRQAAQAIAQEVRIKVTPTEHVRLAKSRTVNRKAYLDYLTGLHYWNRRTEESLRRAIDHFQKAIAGDPTFALGHVGLAKCYHLLGTLAVGARSPREVRPLAVTEARKAIELDPELAEAHVVLAIVQKSEWDWAGAGQSFRRALEINPGNSVAHMEYANFLLARSQFDEAVREGRQAEDLDPLSVQVKTNVGWLLNWARRRDEAIEQLLKTLELEPHFAYAHFHLANAYLEKSMFKEAIESFEKAVAASPHNSTFLAFLASAHASSGNTKQARRLLREGMERQRHGYVAPFALAVIHIRLGDKDQAFYWLERAYEERSSPLAYLNVNSVVDPLRSDPRFENLLRRVGLGP